MKLGSSGPGHKQEKKKKKGTRKPAIIHFVVQKPWDLRPWKRPQYTNHCKCKPYVWDRPGDNRLGFPDFHKWKETFIVTTYVATRTNKTKNTSRKSKRKRKGRKKKERKKRRKK